LFQGFVLAALIGVPLGLLIGWSKFISQMLDPLIQSLRPIPITAWLPFSIAVFGIRDIGSIFLIFLGGFYAIVVNTTQGARDVDRNLVRAALMMGASRTQLLLRVVLPAAMPSIFTGLRIGLGISWTAVIVSEMVAVKSGLGYVLWDAYYGRPNGHRAGRHGVDWCHGLHQRPHHCVHRTTRCWFGEFCKVTELPYVKYLCTRPLKTYPGQPPVMALDRIDLEVPPGEFVALLGPSGLRQVHPAQFDCWL
jgi:ABC-type dipeptide/oligopeptide/nickel transport system permease component